MSQSQRQQDSAVSASSSYTSSSSGDDINAEEPRSQERLQMIDTMKAPIIQTEKVQAMK
jgi:hypothetical protein